MNWQVESQCSAEEVIESENLRIRKNKPVTTTPYYIPEYSLLGYMV